MTKQEALKQIETAQTELINAKEALSKASSAYKKATKKVNDAYKAHFEAK